MVRMSLNHLELHCKGHAELPYQIRISIYSPVHQVYACVRFGSGAAHPGSEPVWRQFGGVP